MILFALTPETSDFLTVCGFIVGVSGLIVGVAGFWIAIVQIRETRKAAEEGKKAAEAAREAAETTLAKSKESYERFVGAFASRLLSELRNAEVAKDWKLAAVRCHDLAEMVGTLATSRSKLAELSRELRDFGAKFTKRAGGEKPKFSEPKWKSLLNELNVLLDQLNAPFRGSSHDSGSVNNLDREVSGNRSLASGEDESEAGELGDASKD